MTARGPYRARGERDRLGVGPPFNRAVLQTLFAGLVLRGRGRKSRVGTMPSNAALDRLANILNTHHAWFYEAQELREFNVAAAETAAAVATLQRTLLVTGRRHFAMAQHGDQYARWMYEATAELYQAVNKDPARVTHRDSLPDYVRDWQWLVDVLVPDFDSAWESTNDGLPGIGEPLVRFWEAVIPYVSGEHPPASSIRRRLFERRKGVAEAPQAAAAIRD